MKDRLRYIADEIILLFTMYLRSMFDAMRTCCLCRILLVTACFNISFTALAQVGANTNQPAAAPPPALPATTQIKKTVIFIQTDCLHIPTGPELAALSPEDRAKWTPEAVAKLSAEELAKLKHDSYSGTGFVVFFPDERLGKDRGFDYLITNRHVAQPGIEDGTPCKVVGYFFYLNHRGTSASDPPHVQKVPFSPSGLWFFPDDASLDLAVTQFAADPSEWDYQKIPVSNFVSQEMVDQRKVVEGDPVLFAGLFVQYEGASKIEPIVRTGSIAMLPSDVIDTTLKKPGRIYLTEAHVFGGNSGSPMFVDINKFTNTFGYDYHLLGVVAGEVPETNDLAFQVSTTYKLKIPANSDISVVVPATEVMKFLMSPQIQAVRDRSVAWALQHKQ